VAPPRREVEWKPEPTPAPPPAFRHDVAAAWSPSPAIRREPSFHPAAYVEPAPPAPAIETEAAPARRDSRDLFRRAVRVAVLVFCGWFIAVLLLIAAFRFINPPFSMLMALQFMTGTPIHKQWVPIERISPNLTRAVIVAEDGRFCQHWGVDFIEAANAIRRASDGYPRGASTITMQVAKNLFLVPAKSYLRKIVEIPLTFAIELAWPKWRILEVYLNIVEWGPGIFGAEAASQAHFGRPAASLTSRQAAQLAVSLPNPIKRDAGSPGPRTAHRASVIQARAARTREASACVDGGR
jgi:monofunctional biosynthetic peptidoglycan transglycosylase